jgi:hypothetical protein
MKDGFSFAASVCRRASVMFHADMIRTFGRGDVTECPNPMNKICPLGKKYHRKVLTLSFFISTFVTILSVMIRHSDR